MNFWTCLLILYARSKLIVCLAENSEKYFYSSRAMYRQAQRFVRFKKREVLPSFMYGS